MRSWNTLSLSRLGLLIALIGLGVNPPLRADGPGGYGNDPYAWIRAGSYETEDLVRFDEADFDWHWGQSPLIGSASALGDIRDSDSAIARARSAIFYHDPYGTEYLTIGADVETWRPFRVVSDSLAPGTPVTVALQFQYEGTLQALESVEEMYCYARASGAITLYDDLGTVLAARRGAAEVECELIDGQWEFIAEAEEAWEECLTGRLDGNGDPIHDLVYAETIEFTALVGERYWLYFDLATSAKSSNGDALGWEASATYAAADFSNTGTYRLSSASDVQFVTVPEPATPMLLALALLGAPLCRAARRRRQAARRPTARPE